MFKQHQVTSSALASIFLWVKPCCSTCIGIPSNCTAKATKRYATPDLFLVSVSILQFEPHLWHPVHLFVIVVEGRVTSNVYTKLNVSQMEHTGNYSKQVLHRMHREISHEKPTGRIMHRIKWGFIQFQHGLTVLSYLNITLTELYDREGLTQHLPVTFIVDRANFGTVALQKTMKKKWWGFCCTRQKSFSSSFPRLTCTKYL